MVLTLQVRLGASKAHKLSDVPWPQLWPDCRMSGVQRIIALGAFIIGLANAHQSPQQVVRSDPKTGQKHVGCYYGVWAYTR